jgi:undecaprenyl-diphosphatase
MRIRRAISSLLVAIPAAAAFVVITRAVGDGSARKTDRAIHRRMRTFRSPALDVTSQIVTVLTSPALLITCSLGVAFLVRRRGLRVWLPIAAAPFVSMTAGTIFSATLPQQNAPTTSDGKREPGFPSGHTTGAATEIFTIAYVLRRSIGPAGVTALVLTPFLGGVNRLYRDRHWASDIAAGLAAGTCIASLLALASEAVSGVTPWRGAR